MATTTLRCACDVCPRCGAAEGAFVIDPGWIAAAHECPACGQTWGHLLPCEVAKYTDGWVDLDGQPAVAVLLD